MRPVRLDAEHYYRASRGSRLTFARAFRAFMAFPGFKHRYGTPVEPSDNVFVQASLPKP